MFPFYHSAIPADTLSQTGMFCVAYSSAWENKVVTSAWWVYAHQVCEFDIVPFFETEFFVSLLKTTAF